MTRISSPSAVRRSLLDRIVPREALRALEPGQTPRVSNVELFFDLVYVFTIIQLSHFLLAHQSLVGVLEAATLFAAVWWAWNYTAWATNWLNPDHRSGRLLMVVLMACALLMAAALPEAYSDRAGLFAGAYVAMALIRAGYMALVFRGQRMSRNYLQLGAWSALSGLCWIAGALLPEQRIWLWLLAVGLDYAAPYAGFWLPGAGCTAMESWPLRGLHLLERNQQVFIIALGESILLLGAMLVDNPLHADMLFTAAIGFLLIVSLWWLYFVHLTETGEHRLSHAAEQTRLARAGLAYAHGVMVCGAIVTAVAIEMVVAHPLQAIHAPTALAAAAGPSIFLFGSAFFLHVMTRTARSVYLVAVAFLAGWCTLVLTLHLSGLLLAAGVLAIMLVLCSYEHLKAARQ
ncbi:low temperature requirement protein A [Nitratireductor sp. ZSWI3]|uniref:low temperature requirement protein A n=1 Tax=Nitratireductor sp. ZSWI3 TaxID=2966359 RepID=UPI00215056EA|nr:low temperature requirement protein A [Nitratireductor sp. ZSWI3]MCR4268035.1 low temperature requirement protein A [Nitratireductor sp. ZSWI3]